MPYIHCYVALIIMKNLEEALENAKNTMRKMDINELNNEIVNIGLKYADGTEIQNLTVSEFETLCNFITEILKRPTKYIR
ncbi:MAG: hypothetical protein RIR01_1383 [Bacteroidota bacterium]